MIMRGQFTPNLSTNLSNKSGSIRMKTFLFRIISLAALTCAVFTMPSLAAAVRVSLKPPASRTAAPRFALTDADGKTERLSNYRGKVVLLNFWATECGGCRLELPWIVEINQTYTNKNVAVIGVSMDISYEDLKNATEAWAKVKPFLQAHQIAYTILMGDESVMKRYDIQALPVTSLIDTSGRIAATYVGLIDKQNVEANISALLAEHP